MCLKRKEVSPLLYSSHVYLVADIQFSVRTVSVTRYLFVCLHSLLICVLTNRLLYRSQRSKTGLMGYRCYILKISISLLIINTVLKLLLWCYIFPDMLLEFLRDVSGQCIVFTHYPCTWALYALCEAPHGRKLRNNKQHCAKCFASDQW